MSTAKNTSRNQRTWISYPSVVRNQDRECRNRQVSYFIKHQIYDPVILLDYVCWIKANCQLIQVITAAWNWSARVWCCIKYYRRTRKRFSMLACVLLSFRLMLLCNVHDPPTIILDFNRHIHSLFHWIKQSLTAFSGICAIRPASDVPIRYSLHTMITNACYYCKEPKKPNVVQNKCWSTGATKCIVRSASGLESTRISSHGCSSITVSSSLRLTL